jgi:hypothetical protein
VLIHTAQEKFATFKQNELSTLLKPTLLNWLHNEWRIKTLDPKRWNSVVTTFIFKMTYSMQCKILCTVKSLLNTITVLSVTGTILWNKVTTFRSNTSYLQHEKMHILHNKMAPNQGVAFSHSLNLNC